MEKKYSIKGMVCGNCAAAIEKTLEKHPKVKKLSVNYDSRTLSVEFNKGNELSIEKMNSLLVSLGYKLEHYNETKQNVLLALGIITIILLLILSRNLGFRINPEISDNMSFIMLFVAGILTSFHCIAMCGGILMTQSIGTGKSKGSNKFRAVKYNLGRVASYTLLGGVIGAIGSVVSVGGSFRGLVSIFAGLFMVVLSLNLLGVIKVRLPRLMKKHTKILSSENGPFVVGLANGFMPCGPLQTMQLYALGTGSILGGMSSMFFFSLGTVPMMLGLGLFTGALSKNGGRRFIQISSLMVLILGLIMVNRGLVIGGYGVSLSFISNLESNNQIELSESKIENNDISTIEIEEVVPYRIVDGVQIVQMTVTSGRYVLSSPLVVGMPTKIELDVQAINRCNSPIIIPKAGVEVDLLRDQAIMEFTPEEVGDLKITCWMGMITTNASIVESLPN